jgi:hypothetical protein
MTSTVDKNNARRAIRAPASGTAVVWPKGVEQMYDISPPTRWRWEKNGRLPPRDVNLGGKTGWKPATLAAAERTVRA